MTRLRTPRRLGSKIAQRHIAADMTLPGRMRNSRRSRAGIVQADRDVFGDIVHFILPDALASKRRVGGLPTVRSVCLPARVVYCNRGLAFDQRLERHTKHVLDCDA